MCEVVYSAVDRPSEPIDAQLWLAERIHWTTHFGNHLQNRLAWTLAYIRQHEQQMEHLAPHVDSILSLLLQAYRHPGCHTAAMDLIAAFHPWPMRWGHWGAWEKALCFAVQVARRNNHTERLTELLEDWASILHYMGRLEEALVICQEAMSTAAVTLDPLYFVSAGGTAATTLKLLGRTAEAVALLESLGAHEVFTRAESASRLAAIAQLRLFQLDFQRSQGRLQDALVSGREALHCLAQLPTPRPSLAAWAHRNYGLALYAHGDYPQAIEHLGQAQLLFGKIGDSFAAALAQSNLGLVYWAQGDLRAAEAAIQQGITAAQRLNAQWRVVKETGNLAIVYLLRGQKEQAFSAVSRHLALAERVVAVAEIKRAIGNRGIIRICIGDYTAALQDLEEEVAHIQATQGSIEGLVVDLVNMSRCYTQINNKDQANMFGERALRIAEEADSDPLRVIALRCLTECCQERPRQRALLERALLIARHIGRRYDEAACLLTLAGITADKAEVEALWQQGRLLLEVAGAEQWLINCSQHSIPLLPLML